MKQIFELPTGVRFVIDYLNCVVNVYVEDELKFSLPSNKTRISYKTQELLRDKETDIVEVKIDMKISSDVYRDFGFTFKIPTIKLYAFSMLLENMKETINKYCHQQMQVTPRN